MYREFILEHVPVILFALFALTAVIKLVAISKLKYRDNNTELFFRSFFPYSRDVIRNAGHEKLKNYYKKNNKFNNVFYLPFIGLLFLYTLMYIIS